MLLDRTYKDDLVLQVTNNEPGSRGRLWVLWNPNILNFRCMDKHTQYIHGQIQIPSMNVEFHFTAIYGLHTIEARRSMWHELRQLHGVIRGPWVAMGDYNTISSIEDRVNGNPVSEFEVRDFNRFMEDT